MDGTWALTIRSLRQDSRLLRYHLLRFAIATLLALAVFVMWGANSYSEAPGRDLLQVLVGANFYTVTLGGVLLFAPSITEEKEEQTLGLLRMTRIGPLAILFGKSCSKFIQLVLVLCVQLPLVFLTLTLGGVDGRLMASVYALVLSQLMGVVSFSMLASVMMRTSGGAVALAGLLVLIWSVGGLILHQELLALSSVQGAMWANTWLSVTELFLQFSPSAQIESVLRTSVEFASPEWVLVGNGLLSALVLAFAALTFEYWNPHETTQTELEWLRERIGRAWWTLTRGGRRKASSILAVPPVSRSTAESSATGEAVPIGEIPPGPQRFSHRSWSQAIAWKEFFLLGGGPTGFWVRCGIAVAGVIVWIVGLVDPGEILGAGALPFDASRRGMIHASEAIIACSFYAFLLDLLYLTLNVFAYEIKRQTWESLQILPLPLGTICRQKICGAATHLTPWVMAFLVGVTLNVTPGDLLKFIVDSTEDRWAFLGISLQVISQFVTMLIVLTWLSLKFNPWVSLLLAVAFYWGVGIAYIVSALMVFGFMSPPGPYYQQVLFNVGWISGISMLGGVLLLSIQHRLRGDAASI